jgi:hypothetical protein
VSSDSLVYACTAESFRPASTESVRWLAPQADYYRYEQMLLTRGVEPPTYETWLEWHSQGYGFAAYVEHGIALSIGAVLRQPSGDWELAGVRTLEKHLGKGYATAVSSFITGYILNERGRSLSKAPVDNPGICHILQKLGYCS